MEDNIKKPDRILVLKAKEGERTTSSTGLVDDRLFKGSNQLHAVMDNQTTLWTFKYEKGAVPEPLKQKYTKFSIALKAAEDYFNTRGVAIIEIRD